MQVDIDLTCIMLLIYLNFSAGINGGYYAGALPVQQAHSTTPHEAPHSAAPSHVPAVPSGGGGPPPQSVAAPVTPVAPPPPQGIPTHAMVIKTSDQDGS